MANTDTSTLALDQWFAQAVAHMQAERWPQAEAIYRRMLSQWPDVPEVQHNLGVTLAKQRKFDEAVGAYQRSLALRPNAPEAYNNLGDALYELDRSAEAVQAYRQALALRPNWASVWNSLASALRKLNQQGEAIEAYHKALALAPDLPEPWNNLGNALREMNRLAEAIDAYRRALAMRPAFPEAWNNMGNTLREMNRSPEAIEAYHRAVAIKPDYSEAWNNLGNAHWQKSQLAEAITAFRKSLSLKPDFAPAWNNLALALKDSGQLDETLACQDRAIALQPSDVSSHSNRLITLHYHQGFNASAIFQAAQGWNARFGVPLRAEITPHLNNPSPQRRLRIGYVSPDFRRHCESLFTLPLFSSHNHTDFEIFCYSGVATPDEVTQRLQRHADVWRDIAGLSDQQAAEMIRRDAIDILVDLALHTARHRLLVFARKPAPVQVTWLGYPGTTGLDAIDYRLSDPCLDPPGAAAPSGATAILDRQHIGTKEVYYSEWTVRLPDCFWCYDPWGMQDSPDVQLPPPPPAPSLALGRVTFGCLNNFCKVSDRSLALWAQVLAAVPSAQMFMVAPPGPHRDRVVQKLGVVPQRVVFAPYQSWRDYLDTYRQVDVFLDTLPYNGGTTSLDALWMGVPVLTRVGENVAGRAGWSLLRNLGLEAELVARTDEQFVQLAVALATNPARLSELHATLRARMERSPLMDGPRFARNVEAAYRQMWQAWCRTRSHS